MINIRSYCPYYQTCMHSQQCNRPLTPQKYKELVDEEVMFIQYVAAPFCFEIHSEPDDNDEEF